MNDPICQRCKQEYCLRSDCEPTSYCDGCAHVVVAELGQEIVRLRAALKPFADYWVANCQLPYRVRIRVDFKDHVGASPTLGDCRRAAEALEEP